MKLWTAKLAVLSLLIGFVFNPAVAADTQDFSFDSFSGDYSLRRDAATKTPVLIITETLTARFPDYDQNHGILRAIPEKYQGHTVNLNSLSVTDENGHPYHYTTSRQNDNRVLKIGDADKYVHGLKTYKISYQLRNVINYQPEHDELFWDINGDQWPQTFSIVTARFHIPGDLEGALQSRQVCYAGYVGTGYQNCQMERSSETGGTLITVTAENLGAYQTLSAVLAFSKGTFAPGPEIAREQLFKKIMLAAAVVGIAVPPLFASGVMFRRWRQFGDDPKGRGIIVPQYEPPKGLEVIDCDFILQQKLRNEAVSALLIDSAVKRYITIYEIPKKGLFGSRDYELKVEKLPKDIPSNELTVLSVIFGNQLRAGWRVRLSTVKKDITKRREIYEGLKAAENSLAERLFKAGYFIKDPKKIKTAYQLWAILPFVLAIAVILVAATAGWWPLAGLGTGLFLTAIVMVAFSAIMPARSLAGVEANDALLGLKDYIKMAEADRIRFLQSPDGAQKIADPDAFNPKTATAKVKLFEKLLPYAMLFSLEKNWAKQFKDLYTQPPDWYQGNWAAFNVGYLSGSLGDFSNSTGQVFSAPSSSSGSGFSGGAGGGGGGGGGGGW